MNISQSLCSKMKIFSHNVNARIGVRPLGFGFGVAWARTSILIAQMSECYLSVVFLLCIFSPQNAKVLLLLDRRTTAKQMSGGKKDHKTLFKKNPVQYFFNFPVSVSSIQGIFLPLICFTHIHTLTHKYLSSIYFPLWIRRTNTPHRIAATLIHLVQSQLQP